MSSSNNNRSSSSYAHRMPPKWASPPASSNKNDYSLIWKEKLRSECLEKARKRRLERVNRIRSSTTSTTSALPCWNTPPPEDGDTSTAVNNNPNCTTPNQYSIEAQKLIQETLWSVEKNCCSTPSPAFHTNSSSSSTRDTLRTPTDSLRMEIISSNDNTNNNYKTNHVFSTPILGYSWSNNDYCLSESELLLLMQEVQEELQSEETILTREIQAVEMQHEQEQRYIEDQIAEYESWMDDKNNMIMDGT